jgi:hypothetical protein
MTPQVPCPLPADLTHGVGDFARFDRIGIWTMVLATVVSAAAPLVFLGNFFSP